MQELTQFPVVIPKRRFFGLRPFYNGALLVPFVWYVLGTGAQVGILAWALVSHPEWLSEVWVLMLIFGGVLLLGMFAIAWNLAGREVVQVDRNELLVRREIAGLGQTRRFPVDRITDVRVKALTHRELQDCRWGIGVGKVGFRAGQREYSFGIGLNDAEAASLAEQLRKACPQGG